MVPLSCTHGRRVEEIKGKDIVFACHVCILHEENAPRGLQPHTIEQTVRLIGPRDLWPAKR